MEQLLAMKPEASILLHDSELHGHSLHFDEASNCVVSQWYGFVSKLNLISSANITLQLLHKTKCPNLLIDHRDVHGTWADNTEWLQNIWLPSALQAGLKHYAHVALPGSYSVMHAEALYARLFGKIEMMIFSDLREAQRWLSSIN